jgi:hypothetical protein
MGVMTKETAKNLAEKERLNGRTLLKLIDEYNYCRHTTGWI